MTVSDLERAYIIMWATPQMTGNGDSDRVKHAGSTRGTVQLFYILFGITQPTTIQW
jgi:hypothetical protein